MLKEDSWFYSIGVIFFDSINIQNVAISSVNRVIFKHISILSNNLLEIVIEVRISSKLSKVINGGEWP